MTYNPIEVRKDFPIFTRTIRDGKRLVYLDSGATAQKPQSVIDAEVDFYRLHNAAAHRGAHQLAEEATDLFEGARSKVAAFIGASSAEVVFTKSATESINLIAYAMGNAPAGNRFHLKAQRLFFPDRLGRQSSAIHRVKRLKLNQLPQDGVRREMASRLLEMKVGVLISD